MDPVVDTCIHHRWAAEADLHAYLEPAWREYVGTAGSLPRGAGARKLMPAFRYPNPAGDDLGGAQPAGGGPAGSSLELLDAQALAPSGTEKAILVFDRGMFAPAMPNPFLANAVVRAINDWNVDRWLTRDERLYGVVLVPSQTPSEAAAEIRRIGAHPKMAGVLMAAVGAGKLFGHPVYHPIYEAAIEHDLPIVIHRGGDAIPESATGVAGGPPHTFAEYATLAPVAVMSQFMSLVSSGVLARYPELRVCLAGAGITWIQGLLRRLELAWRATRRDVPWVRESPYDSFRRQVRVSTYGIERHVGPETLERMIAGYPDLEHVLCFGSGYPSWDTVTAAETAALFPAAWRPSIMRDNAEAWFRWGAPVPS